MYIKIANGEPSQFPYTIGQFRRDHPKTSFPQDIPVAILNSYSVYEVTQLDTPDYDFLTQTATRATEPTLATDSAIYELGYVITDKSQSEAEFEVRSHRNALISETDWTACSDVTMPTEMVAYRQALRDVTNQEGFPFNIVWPEKPV